VLAFALGAPDSASRSWSALYRERCIAGAGARRSNPAWPAC